MKRYALESVFTFRIDRDQVKVKWIYDGNDKIEEMYQIWIKIRETGWFLLDVSTNSPSVDESLEFLEGYYNYAWGESILMNS